MESNKEPKVVELNRQDYEGLIHSIDALDDYPGSQRLAQELCERALPLIKKNAPYFSLLPRRTTLSYVTEDYDMDFIQLTFQRIYRPILGELVGAQRVNLDKRICVKVLNNTLKRMPVQVTKFNYDDSNKEESVSFHDLLSQKHIVKVFD